MTRQRTRRTGTATGVSGELLAGLDLSATTHTAAGTTSDPWTFTDVTGNYANANSTVTDKISKANAIIVVTPYDVTYDAAAHTATGTATGVSGEPLAGLDLTGDDPHGGRDDQRPLDVHRRDRQLRQREQHRHRQDQQGERDHCGHALRRDV